MCLVPIHSMLSQLPTLSTHSILSFLIINLIIVWFNCPVFVLQKWSKIWLLSYFSSNKKLTHYKFPFVLYFFFKLTIYSRNYSLPVQTDLFIDDYFYSTWIYHSLFNQYLVNGCLGCLQYFAITNIAVMNILEIPIFILLEACFQDKFPELEC